jgi:hypothetical protein
VAFGTNDTVDFSEIPVQNMAEKEQKGVECLVLGGGRDSALDGQGGEEPTNLMVAEAGGRPASDKSLKSTDPKAVDGQGLWRIIAECDFSFQVTILPLHEAVCGTGQTDGRELCVACMRWSGESAWPGADAGQGAESWR